ELISSEYPIYLTDESKLSPEPFDLLFFPADESELAAVLRQMAARKINVTIAGARTGLVGGCVPRQGALVSLENFDRVQTIYYDHPAAEWRVRSQCAVNLRSLNSQLSSKTFPDIERCGDQAALDALRGFKQDPADYFYPPDPTEMSASLGGTVATNASGARTYRYGPTRAWVRGIRVMLINGEMLSIPRGKYFASPGGGFTVYDSKGNDLRITLPSYRMPHTKNTSGLFISPQMDLIDLFIGSEGTLGVITEVELVLTPAPEGILSALAFFGSDEDAVAFVKHARGDALDGSSPGIVDPLALEFFDSRSFEFLRRRKAEEGPSSEIPELPDSAVAGVLFETEFTEDTLFEIYEGWESVLSEHGSSMENTWGGMEESELARLRALRHSIAEQVNGVIARANARYPVIHKIGTDAAVPPGALEEMFGFYRGELDGTPLEHVIFGHIGDNH
ncbi:MAG: FAD-binding oxidoreductase, partial [Candidatus Latescibacteria bacterium]|nr:FAD-binding oxidoreductase [Candidatus Latescibacterota bacterium]